MKQLLLIEDDLFLVKVYKLKLEQAGFAVTYLSDGVAVLETAKKLKPDLILLDIVMPVKDGFTVLKELSADVDTSRIPVVVLSALQMEDDIAKGKELGADLYLKKTAVTIEEVIAKINALI